jgi:site-specific recombinase XerD
MIERAAAGAGPELKAHPRMLRHACGYALANKGHDTRAIQGWLGHRSITSTAVYTALAPNRTVSAVLRPHLLAGWPWGRPTAGARRGDRSGGR